MVFCLCIVLLSGCEDKRSKFAIEMVPLSQGNWEAIKYSPVTGKAWSAQSGTWVPIVDEETLPRSDYVIKVAASRNGGWGAIRLDTISGRSWSASRGNWVEIQKE